MIMNVVMFWTAATSIASIALLGILICIARTNGLDQDQAGP